MYTVVGLKADGRVVLHAHSKEQLDLTDPANELATFGYIQFLVLYQGSQIARYEYNPQPRLKEVELA